MRGEAGAKPAVQAAKAHAYFSCEATAKAQYLVSTSHQTIRGGKEDAVYGNWLYSLIRK